MTGLTISATFPQGQYNATGNDRRAEWPPSPARLLTALLASARPEDKDQARALFELGAPVILTPAAASRLEQYQRWVPVQELKVQARNNQEKAPEPGMLLDPHRSVMYVWPEARVDADKVNELASSVVWLGRPTSPAVIAATNGSGIPELTPGDTRWIPGTGTHRIAIGDPEYLGALDAEYQRIIDRQSQGGAAGDAIIMGTRITRSWKAYERQDHQPASRISVPAPKDVIEFMQSSVTVVGLSGAPAAPEDAAALIDTIRSNAEAAVQPVFGTLNGRDRLFGAIIYEPAVAAGGLPILTREGLIAVTTVRTIPTPAFRQAVASALSTSALWTSAAPVKVGPHIGEELEGIADDRQTSLLAAGTHDFSRSPGAQHSFERDDTSHISVRFNSGVRGPLVVAGTVLVPARDESEPAAHRDQ